MLNPRRRKARGFFFLVNGSQTFAGACGTISGVTHGIQESAMPQPPRSLQKLWRFPTALAVAGVLVMVSPPSLASSPAKTGVGQAPAAKPVGQVRFIDSSSSEKPAAREKRLKRECRGRPNAGACLGYAS
jgi:hypothetical protein